MKHSAEKFVECYIVTAINVMRSILVLFIFVIMIANVLLSPVDNELGK